MNFIYFQTSFLVSAPKLSDTPEDEGVEVAFAGRSNAGKSSAINAITHQKTLARTSKAPGRTQMLNFFRVDERRRLVDLPGYGYAKVSAAIQKNWHYSLDLYLRERHSLRGIILLMDIRHPLTDFDWQMIEFCRHRHLPLHIALTKADKLSRGAGKTVLLKVQAELKRQSGGLPFSLQLFSAVTKQGLDDVHAVLDQWLEMPPKGTANT